MQIVLSLAELHDATRKIRDVIIYWSEKPVLDYFKSLRV